MGHLRRVSLALAVLSLISGASIARATPLGLTLQSAPDITSAFVTVNYNASAHTMSVGGIALSLEAPPAEPPPDYSISSGSLSISLSGMDLSGGFTAGSLTIGGTIAAIGATPSPLVTGTATAFGFPDPPGGNILQFLFTVNGGSLTSHACDTANPCLPLGSQLLVQVNLASPSFPGTFSSNYSNTNTSNTSDAAPPTPEPGSFALMAGGVAVILCRRRYVRSRA